MEQDKWKIDVAVLLIFFVRYDVFLKTFEQVKKARPKKLLLWQDGARTGREDDIEGILKCRKIVEKIDWDCEVYRMYNEENYGCDPSTYYAQKWAFSITDKCIVLEDDFVATQSFFRYCKELLDLYENDERVNHICGINLLEEYKECPYDYFFAFDGSGAWASWRRVIDGWDDTYLFLKDEYLMNTLSLLKGKKQFSKYYQVALKHSKTGIPYWESILGFNCMLNSRVAIIPKKNLVSNIGLTENATHSVGGLSVIPKGLRKIFFMKTYEINFPMNHPTYLIPDTLYIQKINRIFANGYPLIKAYRKIESFILRLSHGYWESNLRSIKLFFRSK